MCYWKLTRILLDSVKSILASLPAIKPQSDAEQWPWTKGLPAQHQGRRSSCRAPWSSSVVTSMRQKKITHQWWNNWPENETHAAITLLYSFTVYLIYLEGYLTILINILCFVRFFKERNNETNIIILASHRQM